MLLLFVRDPVNKDPMFEPYAPPSGTGMHAYPSGQYVWGADDEGNNVVQLKWGSNKAGVGGGTATESSNTYKYGHFSARFKSPDVRSQTKIGLVTSFFLYGEPEIAAGESTDADGNGIPDSSEIDIEILNAAPTQVHVTAHTGETERTSRCIDLATGKVIFTRYIKNDEVISLDKGATVTAFPLFKAYEFHTYGFDYYPERIVWWIENDQKEKIVLFDLREHIPFLPMYILGNIWWTDGWTPPTIEDCIQKPTGNPILTYDWVKYVPLTQEEEKSNGLNLPKEKDEPINVAAIVVPVVLVVFIGIIVGALFYYFKIRQSNDSIGA